MVFVFVKQQEFDIMKTTLCSIALCGAMFCNCSAVAATSGFLDNEFCNTMIEFRNCVAEVVLAAGWDDSMCSYLSDFHMPDEATCVAYCKARYPQMQDYWADIAVRFGKDLAYSYFLAEYCNKYGEREAIKENTVAYITYLQSIGLCQCEIGSYVQPRGTEVLKWGANTACLSCPAGGTSEGGVLLYSCFIPGGNFSDDMGSGVLEGNCYANYGNGTEEDEIIQRDAAWQ